MTEFVACRLRFTCYKMDSNKYFTHVPQCLALDVTESENYTNALSLHYTTYICSYNVLINCNSEYKWEL